MAIQRLNQGAIGEDCQLPFHDPANGVDRRASLGTLAEAIAPLIQIEVDAGVVKMRDVLSAKDFGAKGDGVSDDTDALNKALVAAKGGMLFVPAGRYVVTGPVFVQKGTRVVGATKEEAWASGVAPSTGMGAGNGAIIEATGNGIGARWTDIDGGLTDKPDFKPCLVFAGAGVQLENLTVRNTGAVAWDAGVYNPGMGRCSLRNVDTVGKWLGGGYYIDASWSRINTVLTALHPEIEGGGGAIENSVERCWLRGLWGLSVIGTTRDSSDPANQPWQWSEPGTSDLSIFDCRLESDRWYTDESVRLNDGGCFRHDANTSSNATGTAQGTFVVNTYFRTASKWAIKLDRSNRFTALNCYGEKNVSSFPTDPRFEVSSRTGTVSLINDAMKNLALYKDGVDLGVIIKSIRPQDAVKCNINWQSVTGRQVNSSQLVPGNESASAPQTISSATNGRIEFCANVAGDVQRYAYIASSGFRPDAAGLAFGTSAVPFGLAYFTEARVTSLIRPLTDGNLSCGEAPYRWSQVYAATGTINTSDEREKRQIRPIDNAVLRAWARVEYSQFKFNDAVVKKGGEARWHFGVVAQRIKEAFESEGLDAFEYGLLCYDEWDERPEVRDDDGGVVHEAQAAGNRYGVRYEEALALECAYLRSRLDE